MKSPNFGICDDLSNLCTTPNLLALRLKRTCMNSFPKMFSITYFLFLRWAFKFNLLYLDNRDRNATV